MRIEEHIGRQIKALREHAGLTLDALGQAVEPYIGRALTPQAVWQAENGKRDFKAAHLCAFALALDVPVAALLAPPAAREKLELGEGGRSIGSKEASRLFAPSGAVPEHWNALYDILTTAESLLDDVADQRKTLRRMTEHTDALHSTAVELVSLRKGR